MSSRLRKAFSLRPADTGYCGQDVAAKFLNELYFFEPLGAHGTA